jgi:hypothetical protein
MHLNNASSHAPALKSIIIAQKNKAKKAMANAVNFVIFLFWVMDNSSSSSILEMTHLFLGHVIFQAPGIAHQTTRIDKQKHLGPAQDSSDDRVHTTFDKCLITGFLFRCKHRCAPEDETDDETRHNETLNRSLFENIHFKTSFHFRVKQNPYQPFQKEIQLTY